MKIRYLFSVIFAMLAIVLAMFTVRLSLDNRDALPQLLVTPEDASSRLTQTFDSICSGDYTAAQAYIYGNPSLGVNREPEDEVSKLIWNAFVESLSYELSGECYATDDGLAQDVVLTSLNIGSVTATLRERSQGLLAQWVEEADDVSEIYDENNDYKEALVLSALLEAAQASLEEDAEFQSVTITVSLVYRDEQWWVVSDSAFLKAISGGIEG